MALDTGIPNIIITGDFNLNMQSDVSRRKIDNLCQQNGLEQIITEPTHYTETSSTLIDLLLTNKPERVILSGVGDSFLDQHIHYHCPIYGIFDFCKPHSQTFTRKIYLYDQCDYNLMREKARDTDWASAENEDVNTHANNITDLIIQLADSNIPQQNSQNSP